MTSNRLLLNIAIAALAVAITPVSVAAQQRTVSVSHPAGISAVSDSNVIAMPAIPGGNVGFEANPSLFRGASLCVSGLNENWSLRRDGTVDDRDPARRASCSPIDARGQATVANPFGPNAVPWIGIDTDGNGSVDRIRAWAGRDRLTGLTTGS